MPWLPYLALGAILGALAPGALVEVCGAGTPLLWWWLLGLPLAVLAVLAAVRLSLAARWLGFAAAALLGCALAAPGREPPRDATRLLAVRGEVAWVRDRTLPAVGKRPEFISESLGLERIEVLAPAGWIAPQRLSVFLAQPGAVRSGDVATVRGVWSRDARGESIRAVGIEIEPRESGPRGFAWRALDRLGEHRELGDALLLGRGDPPEKSEFRAAGLAHVLAVSGVHLVIAAGLLAWFLRACGLGWGARVVALGAFVAGYTWLTHANPATMRALAMALATSASALAWREPHRLGPVSLAALVLLALDPQIASDIGFQLSLAAVLGLCTLGMDLVKLREAWLPLQPWPLDRLGWRGLLWSARAGCDGLLIGLAATLATMPLVAWHFAKVAPWAWATSLAAGIPATVALWAGLPLLLLSGCWPGGPWEGLYRLTEWSLSALHQVAAWGAQHLPQQETGPPPAALLCLWPFLFLRLRDGTDLAWRAAAVALSLAAWAWW